MPVGLTRLARLLFLLSIDNELLLVGESLLLLQLQLLLGLEGARDRLARVLRRLNVALTVDFLKRILGIVELSCQTLVVDSVHGSRGVS